MNDHDQTPPSNLAAEAQVLGSMLLGGECIADVAEILDASDFYTPANIVIFNGLKQMAAEGKPLDMAGVYAEFAKQGHLEKIKETAAEGRDYLGDLQGGVPNTANVVYYAGLVKDAADLRRLILVGSELTADAYATKADPREVLAHVETQLCELIHNRKDAGTVMVGEAVEKASQSAHRVAEGGESPGLMTGFPSLDAALGGIRPGELVTLAASTSTGKSALALAISANVAAGGGSVLFVSAEMGTRELAERLLAAQASVSASSIRLGTFGTEDSTKLQTVAGDVKKWKLCLMPKAATVAEIASKARQLSMEWRSPPNLIVCDYLQLLKPTAGDNRAQQVAGIAWGLKQLATDVGSPVLMLSQLNREGVKAGTPPSLFSLKESGDIENHSHTVLLMHQPEDSYDTDGAALIWLRVAKARSGHKTPWPKKGEITPGTITLRFKTDFVRFEPKSF